MTRGIVFVLALLGAGIGGATQIAAQTPPQISVTGTGEVSVAPDMARVTLGVTQEAETAAVAMDNMSRAMAVVMDRMTAAGIDPTHMQTGSLRLDLRYRNLETGDRVVLGYVASVDISVQVFDLDRLGAVLDAAVRDGANQMNGLQFDVADKAPFLTAARQAAVADAVAKADVYATAAGAVLGNLMLITEGSDNNGAYPLRAEASFDMASRAVPIAAGALTISATVSMMWSLSN
jgi:hypothetical protein